MKIIETTAVIDRKGRLVIPCVLQQELDLKSKTETRVILTDTPHCLSEAWNSLLQKSDESKNYSDTEDGKKISLVLPDELIETAELPKDGRIDAFCIKGAIIITAREILNNMPNEMQRLFDELHIDPDAVD